MTWKERATELLCRLTGRPDAGFRDGQLDAIAALYRDRRRVLVVQRTGWGKSAVYFITAKLFRQDGSGPTVLISPLLALMRDQILAAEQAGVVAATINSDNRDLWDDVLAQLRDGEVDVLLISPERLNNTEFRRDILPELAAGARLLVVDEAHCISDWGHDFRPDYRRITAVLRQLPTGTPVLCTTATANDRVVSDVVAQLGGNLTVIRGPLDRESLRLGVLDLPSPSSRMAWLARYLDTLPGAGIIYCLTIDDTERLAGFLRQLGLAVEAYSGSTEAAVRPEIEGALRRNRLKAVVATSALGMGFDKPDLGFVVHFQMPGSPVAYYQQVGRAGRAIPESVGILMRGHEDDDILDWFERTAFPDPERTAEVLDALERSDRPLRITELEAVVNLRRSRLESMLKVLEVEGVVDKMGQSYLRTPRPWNYPHERFAGITALRREERAAMDRYVRTTDCLMAFLRRELDDHDAAPCGRCQNCGGLTVPTDLDPALVAEAQASLRRMPFVIEPRRQWPDRSRIPATEQTEEGRALCRWGDGGWGQVVRHDKLVARQYSDQLIDALAGLVRSWAPKPAPAWIAYVPSGGDRPLVADLAHGLGTRLGLPVHDVVVRLVEGAPQKDMQNSAMQFRNVAGRYGVAPVVPSGRALLVDDVVDSRWTITVAGRLLRLSGADAVYPVALTVAAAS